MANLGHDWEYSKENVQPLRGGRKPETIAAAVSLGTASGALSSKAEADLNAERERFERAIANYEGADPLAPWLV